MFFYVTATAEISLESKQMNRVLKIAKMGHPILSQKASDVSDPKDSSIRQIVEDMKATLEDIGDYAGLAAPQVHIPLKIVLFAVPKEISGPSYPEGIPLTAMINPSWKPLSEEKEWGWEGCFSLPGLMGEVRRYVSVSYAYQTLEGKEVSRTADGFHARVIQHECDHLDGVLYPQRMEDMSRFGYTEEIQRYSRRKS